MRSTREVLSTRKVRGIIIPWTNGLWQFEFGPFDKVLNIFCGNVLTRRLDTNSSIFAQENEVTVDGFCSSWHRNISERSRRIAGEVASTGLENSVVIHLRKKDYLTVNWTYSSASGHVRLLSHYAERHLVALSGQRVHIWVLLFHFLLQPAQTLFRFDRNLMGVGIHSGLTKSLQLVQH